MGHTSAIGSSRFGGPEVQEELARCINQLLLKEPFFAHVLSGLARKETSKVRTAAVGLDGEKVALYVNPEFFLKELKTPSSRVAVLKHEILHVVFKHLFRDTRLADHELHNIAADIVVNQYVGDWKLPASAVTLDSFPELDLNPGQSAEYYYRELKKWPGIAAVYGRPSHSDHSLWADAGGNAGSSPSSSTEAVRSQMDNLLIKSYTRTPANGIGSLPGNVRDALEMIMRNMASRTDWKRILRIFSSSKGSTRISHSMKRVSKRYGTRPGIRIKRRRAIAVVIDTSGSITDESLAIFMAEIEGMRRTGADITIIEADCAVHDAYPYRRGREINPMGGGGTDYDPALKYIRERCRVDACIYLTDGLAPEPKEFPNCPILWVLPAGCSPGSHLKWGRTVVLE